jgi:hypothetical protein
MRDEDKMQLWLFRFEGSKIVVNLETPDGYEVELSVEAQD